MLYSGLMTSKQGSINEDLSSGSRPLRSSHNPRSGGGGDRGKEHGIDPGPSQPRASKQSSDSSRGYVLVCI